MISTGLADEAIKKDFEINAAYSRMSNRQGFATEKGGETTLSDAATFNVAYMDSPFALKSYTVFWHTQGIARQNIVRL